MAGMRAAIDLGTSSTKIYTQGGGIVLDEPSVVALGQGNEKSKIKAVGSSARRRKTPKRFFPFSKAKSSTKNSPRSCWTHI